MNSLRLQRHAVLSLLRALTSAILVAGIAACGGGGEGTALPGDPQQGTPSPAPGVSPSPSASPTPVPSPTPTPFVNQVPPPVSLPTPTPTPNPNMTPLPSPSGAPMPTPMPGVPTPLPAPVASPSALTLYTQKCVSCHGANGAGGSAPELMNCTICNDVNALNTKIKLEMPKNNPADCVGDCALALSYYIKGNFATDVIPPLADASKTTPLSGTAPLDVMFDASASSDSDANGSIATYSWTFGDTGTSTLPQITHTYQQSGTYNVNLTVMDTFGLSNSQQFMISVSDAPAAMGSAGCGKTAPSTMAQTLNMMVNGTQRDYILVPPSNYDSSMPYALVYAFHDLGDDGTTMRTDIANMESYAAADAFFVYPTGSVSVAGVGWNTTDGSDDMQFIDAIAVQTEADWCIDTNAVYASGLGEGGKMATQLACSRPSLVSGISSYGGGGPSGTCTGTAAAMIVHDAADTVEPVASGMASRDHFQTANNCDATTTATTPAPCVAYDNCDAGKELLWCPHDQGHIVPDFAQQGTWDFFKTLRK